VGTPVSGLIGSFTHTRPGASISSVTMHTLGTSCPRWVTFRSGSTEDGPVEDQAAYLAIRALLAGGKAAYRAAD
jgi:hypothetical protein